MNASNQISAAVFSAFVKCPTKAHLLAIGEPAPGAFFVDIEARISSMYKPVAKRQLHSGAKVAEFLEFGQLWCSLDDGTIPHYFQPRCRALAIEHDDLSLLTAMTAKERTKCNAKGIFTITRMSYGYRPRRRKRTRPDAEGSTKSAKRTAPVVRNDHKLRALALRKNQIHVVGAPALKFESVPSQTAQCLFRTSGGGSRLLRVALIASMAWRVRTTWSPILTLRRR